MNAPQPRARPSFGGRSKRWTPSRPSRPEPQRSQNARRNYQQYLTLAQAEAQNGNTVAAENYYQYAEHYFRLMTSDWKRPRPNSKRAFNPYFRSTGKLARLSP